MLTPPAAGATPPPAEHDDLLALSVPGRTGRFDQRDYGKVISFWPGRVRKQEASRAHELRIATSGSSSINALVELVSGSVASQPARRVRAAIFAPGAATTLEFDAPDPAKPSQKLGTCARGASCVHALRLLTPEQTTVILDDVKRIGESIGWSDRGVSLPTQDVLVSKLSKESQDLVHRAIRETILPFARQHYPHLNASFDKQPYPRPGNLFIVRYCASSKRPGGRGLKLHKDETKLTFNLCLSPEEGFTGGGTYFPANSADELNKRTSYSAACVTIDQRMKAHPQISHTGYFSLSVFFTAAVVWCVPALRVRRSWFHFQ